MSNLGEQAMEILDKLHTERLAYESEYVPLADAANLLTAYEQTGLDPEAIERMQDAYGRGLTLRTDSAERLQLIRGISTDQLRELVEADRDGRCKVIPDFVWTIGETLGVIKIQYRSWMGRFMGTKFFKTQKEAAEAALKKQGGEVVLDGLSTEAKKLYLDILTGDVLKGEQEG